MSHTGFTEDSRPGGGGLAPRTGRTILERAVDIGLELIPEVLSELTGRDLSEFPDLPGLPTRENGNGAMFEVGACGVGSRTQAAFINGKPCCPTGFHFSEKSGCCIKNRKMNVLNMRAHSRATRRIRGTARALNRAKKAVGQAAREMGACPKPSRRRERPCK